jgi:hypothetical protein
MAAAACAFDPCVVSAPGADRVLVHGVELRFEPASSERLTDEVPPRGVVDVRFVQSPPSAPPTLLHFADCERHGDGLRVFFAESGDFELWFGDGTWARVDGSGSSIDLFTPASSTREDTLSYLHGGLTGLALRLRGVLALHASAVVLGDLAIALVGESGAGKSTTAAALAREGDVVLCDDLATLTIDGDGGYVVHGGPPYLRLWPDSADLLDVGPLSTISPTWSKLLLPVPEPPSPVRLGAICLLEGPPGLRAPRRLRGAEAVVALLKFTYASHLLRPDDRARELGALGTLVEHHAVWSVCPPSLPGGAARFRQQLAALVDLGTSVA